MGSPTRPTSASSLSCSSTMPSSPGRPRSASRGACRVAVANVLLPRPPGPPLASVISWPGPHEVERAPVPALDGGAGRDGDDEPVAVGAVHELAHAVPAAVGLEAPAAPEGLQVAQGVVAAQRARRRRGRRRRRRARPWARGTRAGTTSSRHRRVRLGLRYVRDQPAFRGVTIGAMDKVMVIAGASSGIGAATARQAAEAGYRVVLGARSEDKLAALAEETGGIAVRCDVSEYAQVEALAEGARRVRPDRRGLRQRRRRPPARVRSRRPGRRQTDGDHERLRHLRHHPGHRQSAARHAGPPRDHEQHRGPPRAQGLALLRHEVRRHRHGRGRPPGLQRHRREDHPHLPRHGRDTGFQPRPRGRRSSPTTSPAPCCSRSPSHRTWTSTRSSSARRRRTAESSFRSMARLRRTHRSAGARGQDRRRSLPPTPRAATTSSRPRPRAACSSRTLGGPTTLAARAALLAAGRARLRDQRRGPRRDRAGPRARLEDGPDRTQLHTTPADVKARIARGLRTLLPPRDCAGAASPARAAHVS